MTPAQKKRIEAARQETEAGGGTLAHRRLGNGTLLVTDTYQGKKTVALLGTDGDYIDPDHSVETKILLAYETLSKKTQDWVPLINLRPQVKAKRSAVDAALLRMIRTGAVHVVPDSSRARNTKEARDAAFRLGGEYLNWVGIEPHYDPIG